MIVSFHELAERELNDAAAYYARESPSLGIAFIEELERCIDAIVQRPDAGAPVRGPIRRWLCRRFPYALLYVVKADSVRILAVMNLKRRPGYWVGRA